MLILFGTQGGGDPLVEVPPAPIAALVIVAQLVLTLETTILSIELDTI